MPLYQNVLSKTILVNMMLLQTVCFKNRDNHPSPCPLYGKDSLLLERRLLSRTTEDSVTVTLVLVPWNTCGMTQSTVLGVATLTYLPYCFFNIISPIMSIVMSHFINRKMKSEK